MHEKTAKALQKIKERIENGDIPFNAHLPSERALYKEFKIGRGSARAIMKELAQCGMVFIEPGRGARACWRPDCKLKKILVLEPDSSFRNSSESLSILNGISNMAEAKNIEISLLFASRKVLTKAILDRYTAGECQGLIISEIAGAVDIDLLSRHGIPTVTANSELFCDLISTRVDFREVGRLAGRELIEKGHRNIGVLNGKSDMFIYKEMMAGLKGALAEDDVSINPDNILLLEISNAEIAEGKQKILNLLRSPERPTAFFATRDWRAGRLFECCQTMGLKIPEDVSVISYDNLSWPDAAEYKLTTIAEPAMELGSRALEMLCDWVEKKKKPKSSILHGKLIRRNSVMCLQPL
jgi:LacI family repressor for deo operon, udp, cdd, tsx, nupC, and nupG